MTCKTGDLVGIPFPYSDLSTQKRRPVLVVTAPDSRGDFMGLQVTSVLTEEMAVAIDGESMATGRLPKTSWIRCDKIFTLSDSIIVKTYGSLVEDVLQKVMGKVCNHLGCNESNKQNQFNQ